MAARRQLTVPELERIVDRGVGALPPDEPEKQGLSPDRRRSARRRRCTPVWTASAGCHAPPLHLPSRSAEYVFLQHERGGEGIDNVGRGPFLPKTGVQAHPKGFRGPVERVQYGQRG